MRAWAAGAGSAAGRGEDAELLQALEQSALEHALAESRRTAGRSARDAPLEPSGRPDSAEEGPPAVVQEPAAGPGTAAWRLAEDERLARLLQQNEIERQRLQAARVSLSLGKGSEAAEEGEAGGADRAAGGGRAAAAPPAGPPQQAAEWPWAALSEAAVAEATAAPAHPAPASDGRSADRPQQQQRAASGPVSLGQSADTSSDERSRARCRCSWTWRRARRRAAESLRRVRDPHRSSRVAQRPAPCLPGSRRRWAHPARRQDRRPQGLQALRECMRRPGPRPRLRRRRSQSLRCTSSASTWAPRCRWATQVRASELLRPWSQGQLYLCTLVFWLLCSGCLHAFMHCRARELQPICVAKP